VENGFLYLILKQLSLTTTTIVTHSLLHLLDKFCTVFYFTLLLVDLLPPTWSTSKLSSSPPSSSPLTSSPQESPIHLPTTAVSPVPTASSHARIWHARSPTPKRLPSSPVWPGGPAASTPPSRAVLASPCRRSRLLLRRAVRALLFRIYRRWCQPT
jgi:hypothetical protein